MTKKYRLIWLCPEFTPYHEVFLKALASDPQISLRVEVMMQKTQTHPYEFSQERPYEWRIANPSKRIDHKLIDSILKEKDAWVVVASYLKPTLMATMRSLAKHKRNFLYFTDTPLPQSVEWNSGVPRKRSKVRRFFRYLRLKWIFNNAYRVLATGEPGKDAITKLGCPSKKAVIFPFWVDLTVSKQIPKPDKTEKVLINVGQLTYRKGTDIAIKAFAKAKSGGGLNGVRFKIIGDGPDRRNLEQLVRHYKLEEHILLPGWLQPPQVAEALVNADAFIHTARWDPFPVVILEAMAAGLPIFGSDSSGSVLDRVENGISGFIHETDNIEQLSCQLAEAFSDNESIERMGRKAREKAEEWPPERGVKIIKDIIFNG